MITDLNFHFNKEIDVDNNLKEIIINIPDDSGAWYGKELESLGKGELSSFVQKKLKAFPVSRHCGRSTRVGLGCGSFCSVVAIFVAGGVTIWANTNPQFSNLTANLISNLTAVGLSSIFGSVLGYVTTGCLPVCTSDKANHKQNSYLALCKHFEQMRYHLLTRHRVRKVRPEELKPIIANIDKVTEQLTKHMKQYKVNSIMKDFKATLEYVEKDGKFSLNNFSDQEFRAYLMLYENINI